MGTLIYKFGDILTCPQTLICHGCNMQGVMGAGVAKAISMKYPNVKSDYKNNISQLSLGDIIVSTMPDRIIISALTQEFYGRNPNITYVNYEAILDAMLKIGDYMDDNDVCEIAMPKIGAGLANGDWNIISDIIKVAIPNKLVNIFSL